MKTMEIYKNYGCLAAEKRFVYTYGVEQPTAVISDKITVKIPEDWGVEENEFEEKILTAPWGWKYNPNEVLGGDEYPHFRAIDKDGTLYSVVLEDI